MNSLRALSAISTATADLMDEYANSAILLPPVFRHFGRRTAFHGPLVCVNCFEDNSKVKELLKSPGYHPHTNESQVLLVNGQGSLTCALLGDMIAEKAVAQGWAGIIIDGCVRDAGILEKLDIGIMALAATPRKSIRQNRGEVNPDTFYCRGQLIKPGYYCYADLDGVVILPEPV